MEAQQKAKWKKFWPLLFLLVPVGIYLFVFTVMWLWNAILPEVIGVKAITFWQAAGILILSKILFGGFHFKNHKQNRNAFRSNQIKEKLLKMSDEEKQQFKAEWKERCGR